MDGKNGTVEKYLVDFNEFSISAGGVDYSVCFDKEDMLFKGKFTSESHCHGYHEVFHVLKGELTLTSGNESITLRQGESAIVRGGAMHKTTSLTNTEKLSIQVNSKGNPSLVTNTKFSLVALPKTLYEGLFERLLLYYTSTYHQKRELMSCCIKEMLLLITQADGQYSSHSTSQAMGGNGYRYYLIEQFFHHYGMNGPDERSTLKGLASVLNLSISATQRAVRSIYGISFREKMNLTKETRARFLLTETDLPVSKISEIQGYSSPTAFSNAFKKREGISPGAYRKRHG